MSDLDDNPFLEFAAGDPPAPADHCPFCGRPRGEPYPPKPWPRGFEKEPANHCPTCWHRNGRMISIHAGLPAESKVK